MRSFGGSAIEFRSFPCLAAEDAARSPSPDMLPSDLYLRVRQEEGRLYPDAIVARLPDVPADHPLRKEWRARGASLDRLMKYLARFPRPLPILELGCGNGWLSRHLATLPGAQVLGEDRNAAELSQAARLFGSGNLGFIVADIFNAPFASQAFDIILLASVIQYFPDLPRLVNELRGLLRTRGELHIMDSPLYDEASLQSARQRTQSYYSALGFPEMAAHYFHHTYAELGQFSPRWHYRPDAVQTRLSRLLGHTDSPFPWISIC